MQAFKALPLFFLLAALAGPAKADVQVRSEQQVFYPGGATKAHLQLPFGDLKVEGSDGRDLEVNMSLACSREDLARCQDRARKLRIVARSDGQTIRIRLKNSGRGRIRGIKAELSVKVPRRLHLELDQAAGGLEVSGMAASLEVDNSAGDVDIRYPQAQAGEVNIKVAVGEVSLVTQDGNRLDGTGFPRSIKWRGPGSHKIEIDMTAGDATVRLE